MLSKPNIGACRSMSTNKISSRALFWHRFGGTKSWMSNRITERRQTTATQLSEMLPKVKTEFILLFCNCAKPSLQKFWKFVSILWPPNLHVCKLLISDLKSFLSGKTSRGKHPLNLAEITWSQISTPKKQIHIRSSRAPLKIYFANLEYIFHCCKYNMLQRNYRVHSERKINCMQEHDTGRSLLL